MMIIRRVVERILGEQRIRSMRINKYLKENPEKTKMISSNIDFKDKYLGKRCFIIGNGPSIQNIDFNLLKDEYTFTVNQQSRNERFKQLKTNFHMWSDERFFDLSERREEDMELIEVMKNVNTNDNQPVIFYRSCAYDMIKQFKLDQELDIHYFEHIWWGNELLPTDVVDFTSLVPHFSTVIHYAICLAVYMGFKEIYLLGCDCTGIIDIVNSRINNDIEAYGYQVTDNEKKRMQRVAEQTSIRDELIWYASLFTQYEEIKKYCNGKGVEIYNSTFPSLLNCIPRKNFNDILNE